MINLPQVTLVCMTSPNYKTAEHMAALKKSSEQINFGSVKYIINPGIKTINDWNKAVIYELPKYIETEFALLVHDDGYVVCPDVWENEFLDYDFIGAPWPLPTDEFSYRDEAGEIVRVGNSVSIRSKKLLDLIATRDWKYYFGNCNEDGFICCHNRKWLESQGCRFAPLEVAKYFSKEHEIEENKDIKTFAFHSTA